MEIICHRTASGKVLLEHLAKRLACTVGDIGHGILRGRRLGTSLLQLCLLEVGATLFVKHYDTVDQCIQM